MSGLRRSSRKKKNLKGHKVAGKKKPSDERAECASGAQDTTSTRSNRSCGSVKNEPLSTDDDSSKEGITQDASMGTPSLSKPMEKTWAEAVRANLGDYLLSEEGQKMLLAEIEKKKKPPVTGGNHLSPLIPASTNALMPITNEEEWEEIELCADTGACDNVMPKEMGKHIPILASLMSKAGGKYECANAANIANLGERRCLLWADNSSGPKGIVIQVADVHKPLLSLSRCADMGFESRFGKYAGALIDSSTGEWIPLLRKGNLYVLKAWIRSDPFVRQG